MADSKERFDANKLSCENHKEKAVYFADHEIVYQCMSCGCGYVHNLNTGENYG